MRKFQSDGDDGIWRTISGRRIFIRNGESLSQAMARSGKFGQDDMEEQIEKEEKLSKKELQEKYDIQDWEIEKIEEYTGVNYTSINDQLRKNFGEVDKCTIDVQNAVEGIDNVLNKLPKYKGTVWRQEGGIEAIIIWKEEHILIIPIPQQLVGLQLVELLIWRLSNIVVV